MAVGSIIKNTIVYVIVMGAAIFVAVNSFLFAGLVALVQYADSGDNDTGTTAITGIFVGLLIIFTALGLAINLSLPSIVSDQLVEF